MNTATRNRLLIALAVLVAGGLIAWQMFFSLTPPRHADHDHAIAKLDAGGFLLVERFAGDRRNLVGRPGKVLVMHWFDPTGDAAAEASRAAQFAARVAADPGIEVLLIARGPSWEGLEDWAASAEVPTAMLYLDRDGKTAELMGVRQLPETLLFDPAGLLAHQARGPMAWNDPRLPGEIERIKRGVKEID